MQVGSKQLIRDINSRLVLETIIHDGSISRAAISKKLGLTKATISALVQNLINTRLVIEIGSDDTMLGRKPILLSFHGRVGYAVCVDIGLDTVTCLMTDLRGGTRSLKKVKTPQQPALLPAILIDLISSMQPPVDAAYGLVGIAFGVHGVVRDNRILFTPYYDLSNVSLVETLSEYFAVPVIIENEANLSAIGEKTFLPRDYSSMANISVHSGVGLGLILDHRLFSGFGGHAGEFGHTVIELNGRPCPCGNHGCLEQYVSERVLLHEYAALTGKEAVNFASFAADYTAGLPHAGEIIDRFVAYMTLAVNNVSNFINPEVIIINSSFTMHFPQLCDRIRNGLTSRMNDKIPVIASPLRDMSILLGGISTIVRDFLGIDQLYFVEESSIDI